jgi:hypothetical protein
MTRILTLLLSIIYFLPAHSQQAKTPIIPKFEQRIFDNPKKNGVLLEGLFKTIEVKKVFPERLKNVVVLENGYSISKLKNGAEWTRMREAYQAVQIDVVYTKYPKDKEFWLTDYHELLVKRLAELFKLDSSLNDNRIRWNLVLQSQCETQDEARSMYHGIVIKYEKRKTVFPVKPEVQMTTSEKIDRYLVEVGGIEDSIVYKTLDEHKSWTNALVVMDMTGSMYQYSPQAVLWHIKNAERSGIKHFCYFNDGDRKPEIEKKIGETGGIYFEEVAKPEKLAKLLYTVMRNGYGGETLDENDCEAIIKAEEHFAGQFENLILIADNTSIRDFALIDQIKHPVKVILVGCEWGINVQYINLAYRTGGSLYTVNDDITDLLAHVEEGLLVINANKYKLNKKTNFFECYNEKECQFQYQQEEEAESKTINSLKRSPVGKKMFKGVKGQKLPSKNKGQKRGFFKRLFGG